MELKNVDPGALVLMPDGQVLLSEESWQLVRWPEDTKVSLLIQVGERKETECNLTL